jgi:lipid A ethanolaminephosphotransferase
LYGVLPSLVILWTTISFKTLFKETLTRLSYLIGLVVIIAILVITNFKYTAYFSRENKDLQAYITPLYAIDSVAWFFINEYTKANAVFTVIGDDAVQKKVNKHPTIGIMVVGETARSDHFSLNGYSRETNPMLKKELLINYQKARSCGTSTAFSVPCMFSFLNRADYSPNKAALQSNSLDVLVKAGVKVIWLDNNSSCKGVCDRIGEINLRHNPDEKSPYYSNGEVFDEALIIKMNALLKKDNDGKDILFVLHTLGSHGPKYYKRYPDKFSQFEPACKQATPQECTDTENINAYDNTILYPDHVLSQVIGFLKAQNQAQTFMIYASDHGESLGENGVYLHGLPYFLAPSAQTHVPMLMWLSDTYLNNQSLTFDKLRQQQTSTKISHDNLSHSLLGAFNVKSDVYKQDYDLLKLN